MTMRKDEDGFTLVELLVVLLILALLAALVGPRVIGYMSQSKVKTAEIQMSAYKTALELYHLDVGAYPTEAQGLGALMAAPGEAKGWAGPYLDKALAADPWGNPYVYRLGADGAGYGLVSLGSDGKEGGEGDAADLGTDSGG
jgi:general secretion pathway protein G